MKKLNKTPDEYTRWPDMFHFAHLSLPEFHVDHGVGTKNVFQPPFQELKNHSIEVAQMEQVHGAEVRWLDDCPFEPVQQVDALATQQESMALVVQTADCAPILVFDPRYRIVAAVHVGWRGLAGGIITHTAQVLEEHGSLPKDWLIGIGPAICQACYVIGQEVKDKLPQAKTILEKEDKWTLDLQKEILNQWTDIGADPKKIEIMRMCTKEHPELFPSYRRDKTQQRLYSYVRLQPLA